jgi:hypothetical protein
MRGSLNSAAAGVSDFGSRDVNRATRASLRIAHDRDPVLPTGYGRQANGQRPVGEAELPAWYVEIVSFKQRMVVENIHRKQ